MKRSLALIPLFAATALAAEPVTYVLDPSHTFPSLEFDHMGVSTWRGKFNESSGTVVLDRAAKSGTVDVTVKTASLDFGLDAMHEYAAKADWVDFSRYPTATYRGTIAFEGDQPKSIAGTLTFRGVEKKVDLALERFSCVPHPMEPKTEICGGDATASLHWSDFGMKRYGDENSDRVTLRIQAEGSPAPAPEPAAKAAE